MTMDNHTDKPDIESDGCDDCGLPTAVHNGRRAFAKLGFAVPVLMSLPSRPVHALACGSNIMSGNLSDPDQGGSCSLGWSPGGWCQTGGTIAGYAHFDAWTMAAGPDSYGSEIPDCGKSSKSKGKSNGTSGSPSCYEGGATLASVGLAAYMTADGNSILREIICKIGDWGPSSTPERVIVTAFLNASLSDYIDDPGIFQSILTVEQLKHFLTHPNDVPGGDLIAFLQSTYH